MLAALTVVITAAYILWTIQRVFMGENPPYKDYPDITVREIVCITPLVVLSVALGVLPGYLLLNWMEPSVTGLVDTLARFNMNRGQGSGGQGSARDPDALTPDP